jgi:hypothetical protein
VRRGRSDNWDVGPPASKEDVWIVKGTLDDERPLDSVDEAEALSSVDQQVRVRVRPGRVRQNLTATSNIDKGVSSGQTRG